MQAQLIYNAKAGGLSSSPKKENLLNALQEAGFDPVYKETNEEEDLDRVLADAEGLVVAAGGDGTVRAVALRLLGRDVPLAIPPMGTTNNIAKSLDVWGEPLQLISGLSEPQPRSFDIGRVDTPWGTVYFLEGMGFGFFADVLAMYHPEKGKNIWRGLEATSDILLKGRTYPNCLRFNGNEIGGKFLSAEFLNTGTVGLRLKFAPDASSSDGLLDLVLIENDNREGFLDYAANMMLEHLDQLQTVTRYLFDELRFFWDGFPIHVDGEIRPHDWHDRAEIKETNGDPHAYLPDVEPATITIDVLPKAPTLWLPAPGPDKKNE
jgi:diacylglycerol kinase family enzyme